MLFLEIIGGLSWRTAVLEKEIGKSKEGKE